MNGSRILVLAVHNDLLRTSDLPRKIPKFTNIRKVSIGDFFVLAINHEGKVSS